MVNVIFPLSLSAIQPEGVAVLRSRDSVEKATDLLLGDESLIGTLNNNLPISMQISSAAGAILRTYFEDFYFRIHIIPPRVDFGTVSGPSSIGVVVWNSYLTAVGLTSIQATPSDQGVGVSGPILPFTFKALAVQTYEVQATSEGAIAIDVILGFNFDTPEIFNVPVTGERAIIDPFKINWQKSYQQKLEYKTDIITRRNGSEQRRALRQTARVTLSYTANPQGAGFREARTLMATRINGVVVVPVLPDFVVLAATAPSGSTILSIVETTPPWVVVGRPLISAPNDSPESFGAHTVVSGGVNKITLKSAISEELPGGTKIYRGLEARFAPTVAASALTNTVSSFQIVYEGLPGLAIVDLPVAAPSTFNGLEVWDREFNWGGGVKTTFDGTRETLDFGFGRTGVFSPRDFTTETITQQYLGLNKIKSDEIANFFHRVKGKRGTFYLPTSFSDIVLVGTSPAAGNTIRVAGVKFLEEYKDDVMRKSIAVFPVIGSPFYAEISDMFEVIDAGGTDTIVQLATVLPYDVSISTTRRVSWLVKARNAKDALVLEWLTSTVAQCQMSFQTLRD